MVSLSGKWQNTDATLFRIFSALNMKELKKTTPTTTFWNTCHGLFESKKHAQKAALPPHVDF